MRAIVLGSIVGIINFLIGLVVFVAFLVFTIMFFIPGFEIGNTSYHNPIYAYFEYMPWFIYVVIYITIFALIAGVFLLLASFYYNKYTTEKQNKEAILEEQFSERIIQYLYMDYFRHNTTRKDHIDYFKIKLSGRVAISVFLKVIVRAQDMISEDFRTKINELLIDTNTKHKVEYYLYSYNVSNRILALKIISLLGLRTYDSKIRKFMKSRNFALRNETVLTWVKLQETNNLDFLFDQNKHISALSINSIFNAIDRNLKSDQIDYNRMMSSNASRISTTGAMLLKDSSNPHQKELLKSNLDRDDNILREVAWQSFISTKHSESDINYLINRFKDETQDNKINILNAIKKVEIDTKIVSFLDSVILNESILLKMMALKMLFNHSLKLFYAYQTMGDKRIELACKEVTDFNLV
jgi:hypothetical protein